MIAPYIPRAEPLSRVIGAKNWMDSPEHRRRFPDFSTVIRHREPFFGGGSVFYRIASDSEAGRRGAVQAIIGDINPFVCDLLVALRDHPLELRAAIEDRPDTEEVFDSCKAHLNAWVMSGRERTEERAALVPRAADYLAIMRYGFNGLWRVNRAGEVNVPRGKSSNGAPRKMPSVDVINAAHAALTRCRAVIRHEDFVQTDVAPGDFGFFDPPYDESFTGYAAGGFSSGDSAAQGQGALFAPEHTLPTSSDLGRLAALCEIYDRAGARFMVTNKDTDTVRAMFARWKIERVNVRHSVSCDAESRGQVGEVIVTNY